VYIPSNDIAYEIHPLKNGTSESMAVDGSSDTKIFKWDVPADEVWYLDSITLALLHSDTMAHTVFGSMGSALTNGLRAVVKKLGNETIVRNLKTNFDLLKSFRSGVTVGSNANGFLNENDYFCGSLVFPDPIKLRGRDDDLVKIAVRDDLTTVTALCAEIMVRKYL